MFESESMWPSVVVPFPMLVSSHHSSGFTDSRPGLFWPSPLRPSQPLHTLQGQGLLLFLPWTEKETQDQGSRKTSPNPPGQLVAELRVIHSLYLSHHRNHLETVAEHLLFVGGKEGRMKTGACLSSLSAGL